MVKTGGWWCKLCMNCMMSLVENNVGVVVAGCGGGQWRRQEDGGASCA